jgi:hypothetical protein
VGRRSGTCQALPHHLRHCGWRTAIQLSCFGHARIAYSRHIAIRNTGFCACGRVHCLQLNHLQIHRFLTARPSTYKNVLLLVIAAFAQVILKMTSPSEESPPPSYTEFHHPPPLPPRNSSVLLPASAPPQATATEHSMADMASHDPRSSSTQSLVPDPASENRGLRTLLLVYIHGFMGNETSFQSFPAHVHNLVTITLADSHVVHTKIYPRYRSRHALEVARDDFSKWYDTPSRVVEPTHAYLYQRVG